MQVLSQVGVDGAWMHLHMTYFATVNISSPQSNIQTSSQYCTKTPSWAYEGSSSCTLNSFYGALTLSPICSYSGLFLSDLLTQLNQTRTAVGFYLLRSLSIILNLFLDVRAQGHECFKGGIFLLTYLRNNILAHSVSDLIFFFYTWTLWISHYLRITASMAFHVFLHFIH